MARTVVFIHTIEGITQTFDALLATHAPAAQAVHIADGTLIRSILRAGGMTQAIRQRLLDHVFAAAAYGADAVQFTCSTVSSVAPAAEALVGIPVLKIDAPMFRQAVDTADRIGLIATNPTTLAPSHELLDEIAAGSHTGVQTEAVLCEGAYDALLSGDQATHDALVKQNLEDLAARVKIICLAQASMARVAAGFTLSVPVLSSPEPAIQHMADVLQGKGAE